MMRVAPGLGLSLPAIDSLTTNIRRWENDRVTPGPEYRQVLRAVYGLSDGELGFPVPDADDQPALTPRLALSAEGLAYFDSLLCAHINADNLLGPQQVLALVEHEARVLSLAVRDARGALRPRGIRTASRFHELLGWLQQDCGRFDPAMAATDRARDFAVELGDPLWNAYLLMRKSNIATDAGDPPIAAALAEAALAAASATPPRVHAVILRQHANAQAALGNATQFAHTLDQSVAEVQRPEDDGDQLASYCTERYVVMEAANCWTQLRQPDQALQLLGRSEDDWPEAHRRDQGLCLARSASAHAGVHDIDRACSLGAQAITLAHTTRSARTIAELRRLRSQLAPSRGQDKVEALRSAVASLIGRTT
jgi:tetratricopeptide (TPR) repeat protein